MEKEDFDMDVEILEVVELNEQLRVRVRHCYGEDDFGLSLKSKALDPFTDKPQWMDKVHKLLKKKYSPQTKKPVATAQEYVGQVLSVKDLKGGKVSGFIKRLINTLGFSKAEADEIMAQYPDPIQLRIDIMNEIKLPFKKSINDKLITYYGGTSLGFDSDERPLIKELKQKGELDSLGKPTDKMDDKKAGRKKAKSSEVEKDGN